MVLFAVMVVAMSTIGLQHTLGDSTISRSLVLLTNQRVPTGQSKDGERVKGINLEKLYHRLGCLNLLDW
jgi:hypothetical protein